MHTIKNNDMNFNRSPDGIGLRPSANSDHLYLQLFILATLYVLNNNFELYDYESKNITEKHIHISYP